MRIGEYCKKRRIEKGLTEEQVSEQMGNDFQSSLLWDFEEFDDNDIDGWSIEVLKRYCEVIGIEPKEIAEAPISKQNNLSLAKLICTRREEKGITKEELSERIGYEQSVLESLEQEKRDAVVCVHALREIAKELDLSFNSLLVRL